MKFLRQLFKPKKYVNLKLEIEKGKYHEELVDSENLFERSRYRSALPSDFYEEDILSFLERGKMPQL